MFAHFDVCGLCHSSVKLFIFMQNLTSVENIVSLIRACRINMLRLPCYKSSWGCSVASQILGSEGMLCLLTAAIAYITYLTHVYIIYKQNQVKEESGKQ